VLSWQPCKRFHERAIFRKLPFDGWQLADRTPPSHVLCRVLVLFGS